MLEIKSHPKKLYMFVFVKQNDGLTPHIQSISSTLTTYTI